MEDGDWLLWGPYLPERQWGTVREDKSTDGDWYNKIIILLYLARSRNICTKYKYWHTCVVLNILYSKFGNLQIEHLPILVLPVASPCTINIQIINVIFGRERKI